MINKNKLIIRIIILTFIVFFGLIFGLKIRDRQLKKQEKQSVVVVGVPKDEMGGLKKELDSAFKQVDYLKKGDLLLNQGKTSDAIEQYKIALSLAKSQGMKAVAHIAIANAYEKNRDYKEALQLIIVQRDKYVNEWAKEPIVERAKCLEYALNGDHNLAVIHAQKALEADSKLPNRPKEGRADYIERLKDIVAAKDYILSLKKQK